MMWHLKLFRTPVPPAVKEVTEALSIPKIPVLVFLPTMAVGFCRYVIDSLHSSTILVDGP